MTKEQPEELAETLRSRGLTCSRLQSIEKKQYKDAADFRKIGFINIANTQEEAAKKIKQLRNQVCKLR